MFQDGLAEAQRYLDMGETPAGFSTMPASPEAAPEEASAKPGKRPGSAKASQGGPGGPGISKDAGGLPNCLYSVQRLLKACSYILWRHTSNVVKLLLGGVSVASRAKMSKLLCTYRGRHKVSGRSGASISPPADLS